MNQREMPFFQSVGGVTKFVPIETVRSWTCYRDAVIWCWENRPRRGMNEPDDQAMFSRMSGVHAPHMSRFVRVNSKAPMDMKADLIPALEAYTGWYGVTQYIAMHSSVTIMEEIIEQRRVA